VAEETRSLTPRVVGVVIVLALFVWFVLANFDEVEITFFVWTTEVALAVGLLIAGLLGLAIGYFAGRAAAKR
jgi:uncharacterized integral membrane protein